MIDYEYGVRLAPISSEEELESLYHLRNNPEVWKWCRQRGPIHWDQHLVYWSSILEGEKTDIRLYLVENKGALIGCTGFTSIDHINARAEFSLYIDPSIRGVGLGEAALKTLFNFGFKMLNFNLIWGETFDGNPAYSLFEKLGMVKEGSRREFYFRDGKYIDAHLYSVLRREWKF